MIIRLFTPQAKATVGAFAMPPAPVYIATVCLERNRWASRQPSFRVSEWMARFTADGFTGIELWENHYLLADDDERATLRGAGAFIRVYNTYAGFSDNATDAAQRAAAARAIAQLNPAGVKYNLGGDGARLDEYRRNLLIWADSLPSSCRLLCECHPGTVLEKLDDATAFFADLDPARFGVIAHLAGDAADLERRIIAWGARLGHLHLQRREPEAATTTGRTRLATCVEVLRTHHYGGSASIEFTRGMGTSEKIEAIYAGALTDMNAFGDAWGSP